jgi:hypothetical protein
MAGEIIEGKLTFIQRQNKRAYELPDGHTINLRDDLGDYGQCVELNTPGEGGLYTVDEVEDLDDRVIVHVGEALGEHGPVGMGEEIPPVRGYPFMDE